MLLWDWTGLSKIILSTGKDKCLPKAPSGVLVDWQSLDLPWSDWNATADDVRSLEFGQWSKAQYKLWLSRYVDYYNALALYIYNQAV